MNDELHCACRSDGELLSSHGPVPSNAHFAELFARHSQMVFSTAVRITGNAHDAEDVLQASFLVLLKKAKRLRNAKDIGGWLYQVATRLALKTRTRAVNYGMRLEKYAWQEQAQPEVAASETLAILDEELARVPEKYRASLVLCYLERKSHVQTGAALGLTPDAVKYRLERGKELLRQGMAKRGVTLSIPALVGLFSRAESVGAVTFASTSSEILASFSSTSGVGVSWQSLCFPIAGRPLYQGVLAVSMVAIIGVGTIICSANEERGHAPASPSAPAKTIAADSKESEPKLLSPAASTEPGTSFHAKDFWCELKDIEVRRLESREVTYPNGKPNTRVESSATIHIWLHGPRDAKINWPDTISWPDWKSAPDKPEREYKASSDPKLSRGMELETATDTAGSPLHDMLSLRWRAKNPYSKPMSPDVFGEIIISGRIDGDTYSRKMGRLKGQLRVPVWAEIEEIEFKPLSSHLGQITSVGPDSNLTFVSIVKNAVHYRHSWTASEPPMELIFFTKNGTPCKQTDSGSLTSGGIKRGFVGFAEPVQSASGFYAIARIASKVEDIVVPFDFTDIELPTVPGLTTAHSR